jgi:hypothetical protein
MSLKKSLFLIGIIVFLLLPAAMLLKNQTPWNCFNFTLDESFYAQAASNWSEGKGYRMAGRLPFDPTITAGIPLAWGTNFIHWITGEEISNSGRIFVYFTFILSLLSLARSSYRRDRNWLAVPIAIWFFTFGLSKIPSGGYLVFGFLGEMPGILAGILAYRALDERKPFRAGIYSFLAFLMKPTFVFFVPAVGLAALLQSKKSGIKTGVTQVLAIALMYFLIAEARGQSVLEYLQFFVAESRRIAHDVSPGNLFDHYAGLGWVPSLFSLGFIVTGGLAILRARKTSPGLVAAFLYFSAATLYFLATGRQPVGKQWSAVLALTLAGFSVPWAGMIAGRFSGWIPKEFLRAITLAIIVTWILSVGQSALHAYKRIPETACPSKEQTAINRDLRKLVDSGEVTPENLAVRIKFHPYTMSLYKLGWDPIYAETWDDLRPKKPKWIYGETSVLFPEPKGCTPHFKGETFSVLICEK